MTDTTPKPPRKPRKTQYIARGLRITPKGLAALAEYEREHGPITTPKPRSRP